MVGIGRIQPFLILGVMVEEILSVTLTFSKINTDISRLRSKINESLTSSEVFDFLHLWIQRNI